MNQHWFDKLKEAAREVIRTEKICRANPLSWSSRGPDPNTEEGRKYLTESDASHKAMAEFWMLTDCEYNTEEPYAACWEWRYAKVMARKCCWYQLKQPILGSRKAGNLMSILHRAEAHLYDVLGLSEEYKSPCQYIEEAFPKLKMQP